MAKAREVVRPILFIMAVFALQVPLFLAILKLIELKGQENNLLSIAAAAGRALPLGSLNMTSPSLKVEIEPSSVYSDSHSPDCSSVAAATSPLGQTRSSLDDSAFKPLSFANYPFVLFSVYRHTMTTFYVLGITSVVVRRYENDQPVYRCEWIPGNKSNVYSDGAQQTSDYNQEQEALVTEAKMLYVQFDENGMAYVPAVVNCTFNQSVGADGEGGLLRLHLANGPNFWGPFYVVEDVFRELPGEVNEKSKSWLNQGDKSESAEFESESSVESELPYKYAFCGPPLYGPTHNVDWIPKWLAYHHYLWEGKAHFYFYEAEALDLAARQMLEPWITAGLLTVIEAVGGAKYPSWYRNQLLFINDCIHRTRFKAQWTFFHDLDELLYVPAPNTLASLLEEHRDKPWMTFGNLPFSSDHCKTTQQKQQESPNDDRTSQQPLEQELWQFERFLWRNKQPECMHEDEDPWNCIGSPGRRKYVVNPRKVFLSGVHQVAMPTEGGVNFNASVARVHHFQGITNPRKDVCNRLVNMSDNDSEQPDPLWYELDETMAESMPRVREFAGPLLLPQL